jgi:asparagine synthase (glutamine-hydrolysing)
MALQAFLLPSAVRGSAARPPLARSPGSQEFCLHGELGTALLRADSGDEVLCGDGFVAAWTHGVAAQEIRRGAHAGAPSLWETGAGSLVVATSQGLTIARGPFGGRPLYYRQEEGRVLVSSTLSALVEILDDPRAFDLECLGALGLAQSRPDPRSTPYLGIKRVLACETLTFTRQGVRRATTLPLLPERRPGTARDHAHALREELAEAVARAIRGFSAVGVFAGGGLDSSGLLALLAERARRGESLRFTGVTYDFAGPGDDRPHLAALLEMTGATTLRLAPGEIRELLSTFFVQEAAPCTWPTCPIELLGAQRAKAWGADVLMGGVGGDDVLDGDESRFAERVLRGELGAVVEAMTQRVTWTRSTPTKILDLIVRPVLRRSVPPSVLAWHRRRWQRGREAWAWAGPRLRDLLDPAVETAHHDGWLGRMAVDQNCVDYSDARGQTETACGLPWVDPYLDPTFVSFLATLPPEELFYGRRQRGLFREAMKGLLPESLRLRPDKASFETLGDEMFAAVGGLAAFAPLLTMEATADLGLVRPAPFRRTFERVVRKEATRRGWLEVWPMLAVECFLRDASVRVSPVRGAA